MIILDPKVEKMEALKINMDDFRTQCMENWGKKVPLRYQMTTLPNVYNMILPDSGIAGMCRHCNPNKVGPYQL